jgi:uncharacterized protein YhhL (DUF1145 family)
MIADTLKGAALLVYAVALATLAGWLEGPVATAMAMFGGAMLFVHALEVPFVLGYLRRHRGPLAVSIALNLLFGLLHWVPLKRGAAAAEPEKTPWVS